MSPRAVTGFEIRLANGELEQADSLWAARHVLARRIAFAGNPADPVDILPAEISKTDPNLFGGRVFLEEIRTATDLTTG